MNLEALYFSKLSETGCVDLLLYCCERLWSIFVFVSIISLSFTVRANLDQIPQFVAYEQI